ncbi:MAG: DUF4468 domain-containing protein [Spirosomataceae bacterium]
MKNNSLGSLYLSLIFTFCILPNLLFGQRHFPRKDGKIVYEKVDSLKGFSKEKLYGFSKKWFADTFKNSKAVIQTEDFETGQIIGKGETYIVNPELEAKGIIFLDILSGSYRFTIQIDIKDEKYRIRIYDIARVNRVAQYGYEILQPIEDNDKRYSEDKRRSEKWKMISPTISVHFYGIMDSFSKEATEAKSDDF